MLNRKCSILDMFGHIEILNIHMFHSFCPQLLSILFEKNGTHVILVYNSFLNCNPLFSKNFLVHSIWGNTSYTPITLLSMQLLDTNFCFQELLKNDPFPKEHGCSCMPMHVWMHCKRCHCTQFGHPCPEPEPCTLFLSSNIYQSIG